MSRAEPVSRCLAVCCDGTWNKADSPRRTNVRLTYEALFPAVRAYYDEGVGTHWYDRIRGGVVGTGLGANVEQAYRWLCETYERWDSIYLFGFSRGAYTARSVAGIVGLCGIQKKPGAGRRCDRRLPDEPGSGPRPKGEGDAARPVHNRQVPRRVGHRGEASECRR